MHVQLDLPTRITDSYSWFVPKSWTLFPIDTQVLTMQYHKVRQTPSFRSDYHTSTPDTAATECLYQWSSRIERAVDLSLRHQHSRDPLYHAQRFLPKTFRGRCATPRLVRNLCPRSPKRDCAGYYEPPCDVTSLKSRLKVRQIRRLRNLEQAYKKYHLDQMPTASWPTLPQYPQLCLLWQAIRLANGYGRSWVNWLLQFEAVPAVSQTLPSFDQLYCARQITQFDADMYCHQEARLRRSSHKHGMELDAKFKSHSQFYQRLKAHEDKILPGFPVQIHALATMHRSQKGLLRLTIHQPVQFRLFAAARFGAATLRIMEQHDHVLSCQILEGVAPTHDTLRQDKYAFELDEMAAPFHDYWSQFWSRDTSVEEEQDEPWQETLHSLTTRIPPTATLPVHWADPHIVAQTIRRLKPYKAVGIDGWRAEELQALPFEAILDLAHIFANIWPQGLSAHHLIARVILLAKRNPATSITDGRPITIMGYISRLTSKIIADQLLSQWAQTWPSAISGGLPFRGVQDITFLQQFQIESAKKQSLPWRGFTLDLIKAFNLLPRRVIFHLLVHHGAPPDSVQFWFMNLRRLTRRLQVRNNVGPPIHMTTGVPEGDSLSVCAMLVVSSAFYWTLHTPTVFPYAYADNWSYLTTNQRDNIQAFAKVQQLVSSLRMSIDYAKSWVWGATADARREWQEFLRIEFSDDNTIPILNSTKDLGCMTHYTRHITLGHLKTKISSAIQRCKRIRRFQADLLQKARFIQTAVWPHAFFGAETQIVGEQHFRTLRREAAIALVGPESQVSSWLAVHAFSPQLQDPLLYVISTALTFLRRLFHHNSSLATKFLNAVVHHTGAVIGPAGALARYLNMVGWSLDCNGHLTLDGYLSVSIRQASLRQIRQTLRHAWSYQINRQICHRKGVTDHPFDFTILSRVLRTLSVTALRQIAYNLTGGYQVGAVKALWTSTVTAQCPFCDAIDTHAHQQLQCPAFAFIRQKHPQAVTYLTHNPHKLWLPLPVSFPKMAELRQLLAYRGSDTSHTSIHQTDNILYFFTDGSADTPLNPETRRAAWSVIQFLPDSSPTPYITIKIQHVQGIQSIARAELAAVTWIVRHASEQHWPHTLVITTDSQYVINTIHQVTRPHAFPSWHRLANADLLQLIADYWQPSKFILRKVRSHQDIAQMPPGTAREDALGNSWADTAAVRARQTDHPVVDSLFRDAQLWHNDQYTQTRCILEYLAALNLHHTQLKQAQTQRTSTGPSADLHTDWGTIFRARERYRVPPPAMLYQPEIHPAFITACVWGNQYADLVLRFCASLQWPSPDNQFTDNLITDGITWHELAIAFIVNTGLQFPTWVRLDTSTRAKPLHWQDPRVLALPVPRRSLREQAEAFRTIVLYLQGYSSTPLLPAYSKTGSLSLTKVGWGRSYTGGFPLRPEIPNAGAVQRTLLKYAENLHCRPPYHPDGLVPMQFVQTHFPAADAINLTFHQSFLYRRNLRKAWHRRGDLGSVPIPAADNS